MRRAALADSQLQLVPARTSVYAPHGRELLDLLNRALRENRVSHEVLAQATGTDPSHLSRMLAGKGAHPSLDVIAAIVAMDAKRVFVSGFAALCGGEWSPARVDPLVENRRLREELLDIRAHVDRVLGGAP